MEGSMMTDHWLTAAEMAGLMGISPQGFNAKVRRHGWREPDRRHSEANPHGIWRRVDGVIKYSYALLPSHLRSTVPVRLVADVQEEQTRQAVKARLSRDEAWKRYEHATEARKERARRKLRAVIAVHDLVATGMTKDAAVRLVGKDQGFSASTYYAWEPSITGVPREDWLAYLLDHYTGRTATAEISPEAWEFFCSDYLRESQPGMKECYLRLQDVARARGWTVPSLKTLQRKLEREVSPRVIVLKREGEQAHDRLYPAQRRDRSVFHALQAVNYDGHKLDVFVTWPDGKKGRAILLAFQDLASGKILSWRVDRSESADAFRLAFGDVIETYGIPDIVFSDNTMAAAAKANTGGTRFRHRYKVKDDDVVGMFPALGVDLRFTKPAHGQSKPIERAFGDLARYISKAPECEGAYTGNSPENKPSNYGSRSVPLDVLLKVCEREIARFNSRADRESLVAQGRSFDDVFAESYATAPIRKPLRSDDPARRLWLLPVIGLSCRAPDGAIHLHGNRYWSECLVGLIGKKVGVRFDPDNLHRPIHVYRLDGSYVGAADCVADVGFLDAAAAKEHARALADKRRHTRKLAEAQQVLDAAKVAALLPPVPNTPPPEARVIRPAMLGNTAVKQVARPVPEDGRDPFMDAFRAGVLTLVKTT
jgi:putative transposase